MIFVFLILVLFHSRLAIKIGLIINVHSPSTEAAQNLITMSDRAHLEPHSETNWLLSRRR